jgi:hypothetical protein
LTSYATVNSLIQNSFPSDLDQPWKRDNALARIEILEKPPYVVDQASAKAWADLANQSARSGSSYVNRLAQTFKEIGCAADGTTYVISGLMRELDHRSGRDLERKLEASTKAEVAAAFLDEATCPGARGLSEENKAKLQEIRDRSLPAPAGPGTAAR